MILNAKNLYKSFPFPQKISILSGVSLEVDQGESVAICGRSGEGKTTLLHILATLETPDLGTLEIQQIPANASNAERLRNEYIGLIFQSFNLLEDLSALENVLMPARIGRKEASLKKGLLLLERVGLQERAYFPAKLLSGGERQRVAIARALCNDPPLILADEPSGNLDQDNAKRLGQLLLSLVKEEQKSLVLVTHDEKLAQLCDETLFLEKGLLTKRD